MNTGVVANQYISQAGIQPMVQNYQYKSVDVGMNMSSKSNKMNQFWTRITNEIKQSKGSNEKRHELPMARIKKIMKMDDSMIGSEIPFVIAKACEIFIQELTLQAWMLTEEGKRRTLQKVDITNAINSNDIYDFLIDIIPRDDQNDFAHPESKVPSCEPYVYLYNNNPIVEQSLSTMPNMPSNVTPFLQPNQTNYPHSINQNMSSMIPQNQPSNYPQSIPQPLPSSISQSIPQGMQNNNNYMFIEGSVPMQQTNVPQNNTMINAPLMGLYSYSEN